MKFGIIPPYGLAPIEDPQFASEFARLAEDAGFESIWVVEHVVMPLQYDSVYPYDPSGRSPFHARVVQPDPLVWLSHIAARTDRIRLATGVLNIAQRNPLLLAKQVASLDRLSGGRVLLGIGTGWVREEAEAVGTAFAGRGRRCDESIRIMRTLWRDEVASFDGDFTRFRNMVCEPRPLQPDGVPIIIGGHSKSAARRAGRLGDGFYPLGVTGARLAELRRIVAAEAEAAGRDPAAIELTCLGGSDATSAEGCQTLGAARMVVASPAADLAGIGEAFERLRRDLIEPFAEVG